MVNGSKVVDNERILARGHHNYATDERLAETKPVTQIFKTATLLHNKFDELLSQYDFWKTLKIYGWISTFIQNSRNKDKGRVVH